MALRWLHANVTCHSPGNTGMHGYQFKNEKPKKINNKSEADKFRGHPWFSVLDFFHSDIEKISAVKEEPVEVTEEESVEVTEEESVEVTEEPVEVTEEKSVEEPKKVIKKKMVKKKVLKKKSVKKSDGD